MDTAATALWMLGLVLIPYVGSYLVLSRRGMSVAEQYQMKSFLYLPYSYFDPNRTNNGRLWERVELGIRDFYEPLNSVELTLGTGMTHDGSIPLMLLK